MEFLSKTIADIPILRWLTALGITLGVAVGLRMLIPLLSWRLRRWSEQTLTEVDDRLTEILERTRWFFMIAVGLWVAVTFVHLQEDVERFVRRAAVLAALAQCAVWGAHLVTITVDRQQQRTLQDDDAASATGLAALGFILKLVLFSGIALVALDNLGFDVTALVAGLGVGGIAVALAVQNILGDLFASLSIVLDKPFVIGDFLIVGDYLGTVEKVGLKTTRLRSLGGEQIIVANSDLVDSRIRNYKQMQERRVVFSFGVLYQTTGEQLKSIPKTVEWIIREQELARFDRAHFQKFGDSSLDFEVVYYVLSPDYNVYMDVQQAINLELVDVFEKEAIGFAFPTRSLYLQNPIELKQQAADKRASSAQAT